MPTAQRAAKGRQNGNGADSQNLLAEAILHEDKVAAEAGAIWAEGNDPTLSITPRLYLRLRPLLRRAIPPGYIERVSEKPGKPYDSTGVKSVQVQMDRLDNVLLPHNWGYSRTFSADGKLCEVHAWIGPSRDEALVVRDSYGGVKQGSTEGNIFKGSFTNAAKPAFARLGPGWEVYVGAADFDPDTDQSAAEQQAATEPQGAADVERVSGEKVAELGDKFEGLLEKCGDDEERRLLKNDLKLFLGSKGVPTPSVRRAFAAITPALLPEVETWLAKLEPEATS